MQAVLTEIISLLGGGIVSLAQYIGQGLNALVQDIFVVYDSTAGTYSLSVFGSLVCVFAGIALAIGISRMIVRYVTSLGN